MQEQRPKVGVGVLVFKDGKILLGKRLNAHGEGQWCGPGGHVEFGESIEECAKRETLEEAGIEIDNVRPMTLATLLFHGKHYLDVGVAADWIDGEPQNHETHKRSHWEWFDVQSKPEGKWFGTTAFVLETALDGGELRYCGTIDCEL